MAVLQKNARSLMLLRLIGKNQNIQSSQLRALSQFLSSQDDLGFADWNFRSYSVVTSESPLRDPMRDDNQRQAYSTGKGVPCGNVPHSARNQAGVLLCAKCTYACQEILQNNFVKDD